MTIYHVIVMRHDDKETLKYRPFSLFIPICGDTDDRAGRPSARQHDTRILVQHKQTESKLQFISTRLGHFEMFDPVCICSHWNCAGNPRSWSKGEGHRVRRAQCYKAAEPGCIPRISGSGSWKAVREKKKGKTKEEDEGGKKDIWHFWLVLNKQPGGLRDSFK